MRVTLKGKEYFVFSRFKNCKIGINKKGELLANGKKIDEDLYCPYSDILSRC